MSQKIKLLMVDNYDSYTFNLFQRLLASGACGDREPLVLPNNRLTAYARLRYPSSIPVL